MNNQVMTKLIMIACMLILCTAPAQAQDWQQMTSPVTTPLKAIWGTDTNNLYAVGSAGVIIRYNGSAWTSVTGIDITTELRGIHGTKSSNIVAVGAGGIVLQYNGTTWSKRSMEISQNLNAVWVTSASDLFIAGESGVILECDQSSCTQNRYLTDYSLNALWGASADDVYAVGGGGTILHYDGTGWSAMTSNTTETLYEIWGAAANDIFAVGANGTILHYNGTVWTPQSVVKRDYYAICGIASPYRVYISSKDGKISYYDSGRWTDMTSGTQKALQGIWVSEQNEAFIVGDSGLILHYTGAVTPDNTPPQASFTVTVSTDDPLMVYVDASASTDNQTPSDQLEVQWDWESDGSFDTQYSTSKVTSNKYAAYGTYTITLRVKDEDGLTATASQQIVLEAPGPCPAQQLLGEDDPRLETLRLFRDRILARSCTGKLLISIYYCQAETLNAVLAENPMIAAGFKAGIETIMPLLEGSVLDQ